MIPTPDDKEVDVHLLEKRHNILAEAVLATIDRVEKLEEHVDELKFKLRIEHLPDL